MELQITDKIFQFKFGYGFLKRVNDKFTLESQSGVPVRTGVSIIVTNLLLADLETTFDVLMMANVTEIPRVTTSDLEALVDQMGGVELVKLVLEELKKSEYTKTLTNKLLENTPLESNILMTSTGESNEQE